MAHNTQNRAWREQASPQAIEVAMHELFAQLDRLAAGCANGPQRWAEHCPHMRERTKLVAELRERGFVLHGELVLAHAG